MTSKQGEFQSQIGQRIRKARVNAGLTQKEVGNKLGISQDGVSRMETGIQVIDIYRLAEIAAICHMPLVSLVQESEILAQCNMLFAQLDLPFQERAIEMLKLLADLQREYQDANPE